MDKEIKREARKQYLHYFRVWFTIIGVLAVVFVVTGVLQVLIPSKVRTNHEAPKERVYDYAEVLTDEEEENLRDYIAIQEEKYHVDLVLVTIKEDVKSSGNWDTVMMKKADDFWDNNNYGYNKGFKGDGALLLDNSYEGQKGCWLSTSGRVYEGFSENDISRVRNAVNALADDNPYEAYKAYVDTACSLMIIQVPGLVVFVLPLVIAGIYLIAHMQQKPARDTTTTTTYVAGGRPVMRASSDDFLRKNVTSRRIETSSGGGSSSHGSSSSGRGGSHVSSSGARHGGGGGRR